jgi:threonine/homoserine/homoserine lactone efflux protein
MMKQYSILFFWGMMISFLGTLPPGALNITATQITAGQGRQAAIIFALGSSLAEAIIVRLALTGMNKIIAKPRLFQLLEWITAGLLLAMTIGCFMAATKMGGIATIFPDYQFPPFTTGILMTVVNPLHIPFWLGWTSVLISKQILTTKPAHFNWFITGTAAGTFCGFLTFIYTGQLLIRSFESNQFIICLFIGLILMVVSMLHIRRILQSPVSIRYAKMKNQVTNNQ